MANNHSTRKPTMKRVHGLAANLLRTPTTYMIFYEIGFVMFSFFREPSYFHAIPNWYWAIVFGPVLILPFIERKREIPLPFTRGLAWYEYMIYGAGLFVALIFLILVVLIVLGRAYISLSFWDTFSPSNLFTVLKSANAGVTEESFKVLLTNFFAWGFRRKRNTWLRKTVIVVSGMFSVVIWAYMHLIAAAFTSEQLGLAILAGLLLFAYVYREGNYVPLVIGHGLFDLSLALHWFPFT